MRDRSCVGVAIGASLRELGADTILPLGVEGEEHQGPGGSNGGGLMASEVDALAVVDDELFRGVAAASYGRVAHGSLHDQLQEILL